MLGLWGTFQNRDGCQSLLEPQRQHGCYWGSHLRWKLGGNLPGFSVSPTHLLPTNHRIGHFRQSCQPAGRPESMKNREEWGGNLKANSWQPMPTTISISISRLLLIIFVLSILLLYRTPANTEREETGGFLGRKSFAMSQRKSPTYKEADCSPCSFQTYICVSCVLFQNGRGDGAPWAG